MAYGCREGRVQNGGDSLAADTAAGMAAGMAAGTRHGSSRRRAHIFKHKHKAKKTKWQSSQALSSSGPLPVTHFL